jgi:predicted transposase/invertase (TIGR01784 family)
MTESILPPKSNTVFQLLFGDQRNVELLADFLKAVIDIPEHEYQNIVIVNPYLPREYPEKKLGIVDIRVTTRSGQIIHVEIQKKSVPEMRDRLIIYDSSLIAGQIDSGKEYALKRVISILITNYPLILESPLYHHRFTLYDHRVAVEFTDILKIHTLELPKIPETPEPADVYLCHWLRFLRAETMEELKMVANASPALQKATAKVMKLSKDEHARMLYEAEMKARDYELVRLHAARTEGKTEGRTGERIAIARNMLERNIAVADISDITGLSFDEIKKLAH